MRAWILVLLIGASAAAAWWASDRPGPEAETVSLGAPNVELDGKGPALDTGASAPPEEDVAPIPVSVAPWIDQLDSEDEAVRRRAAWSLGQAIDTGTVPLDELLQLAVGGVELRDISMRARKQIARLHIKAAALLPMLFDWIDDDGEEHPNAAFAARLIWTITCGKKYRAQARELLRPFTDRLCAAIADADNVFTRQNLLYVAEAMGDEVADMAPDLVARIHNIEKGRAEYEAANPGLYSYINIEYSIMDVLSSIGAPALPSLAEALGNDDGHGHFEMGRAIEKMDADALPALEALLSHQNPRVVAPALVAIARHRKGDPELLEMLRGLSRHPDAEIRVVAIDQLGKLGAAAVPELLLALRDTSPGVRKQALKAIERVPDAAKAAMPQLLALMRTDKDAVSARTLGRLGPAAAEAAPQMIGAIRRMLDNESMWDHIVRDEGYAVVDEVHALESFGSAAMRYLVDAALGDSTPESEAAVFALHRMSSVDAPSITLLAGKLGELKGVYRIAAAGLLFDAGDDRALDIVRAGLGYGDGAIRATASQIVRRAGLRGRDAWPELFEALVLQAGSWRSARGEDYERAQHELQSHARALDVIAKHDLSACLTLLRRDEEDVAREGARVFAAAGERGLALLKTAWSDVSVAGRVAALRALGELAFRHKDPLESARPWIADQLRAPSPSVRLTALRALKGAEYTTRVMPVLIELLNHDETLRLTAYMLGQSSGKALLPYEAQLRALPVPKDESVRSALAGMWKRIEDARPPSAD